MGGGGSGTGGSNSVSIAVGFGSTSGQTIGAKIMDATRATCPVTPAQVVQRRFVPWASGTKT
ncbi:hypothetical protein SBA3_3420007 [Candidatus Sulfopaludibacter sp. SbA3]|nr:hypothetical protein SBA3_3420007 [Candidatus Sulfopaludibacter sp. SbA3]